MPILVEVLIYEGVDALEVCGPFEAFSVANRETARGPAAGSRSSFDVRTVSAERDGQVTARGGLRLMADHTPGDAPHADIVLVPGGVTPRVEAHQACGEWLRAKRDRAAVVASVGTGTFLLAEARLLTGAVTTHSEKAAELRRRYPQLEVDDSVRFIDQGSTATAAGSTAGMDLALHLVARFSDLSTAMATAHQLEYSWRSEEGEERPPPAGEGLI